MIALWLKTGFAFALVVGIPTICGASQKTAEQMAWEQTKAATPTSGVVTTPIQTAAIKIDVLVTDEDGRIVPNLKNENFRLLDNGKEQPIEQVAVVSEPLTVVVLMEFSSASNGYFANRSAQWADRFLTHLDERDWVALVTYDLKPTVQSDFTHNRYSVRDNLRSIRTPLFSESNLFDALIETLDKLEEVRGRTAILLISTGANSFSAAPFDEVMQRLRNTDTTVFCVGLAEPESVRFGNSAGYQQSRNWLKAFATETGGLAVFPRFEGELPAVFDSIVGFLHNEYELSFTPPKQSLDGRYHRLKVEVVGPDRKRLRVFNEKGKSRNVEVYAPQGYVASVASPR